MKVEFTRAAKEDLREILLFIAQDNPVAALEMLDRIEVAVGHLASHPHAGRQGRVESTRELVVTSSPFIAAYRVTPESVQVLRVLHGARRWPTHM